MVAGHLQIKKGYYYMVLNLKSEDGKRKTKWISTGIQACGKKNLKAAEAVLLETRHSYKEPIVCTDAAVRMSSDMLFFRLYVKLVGHHQKFGGGGYLCGIRVECKEEGSALL